MVQFCWIFCYLQVCYLLSNQHCDSWFKISLRGCFDCLLVFFKPPPVPYIRFRMHLGDFAPGFILPNCITYFCQITFPLGNQLSMFPKVLILFTIICCLRGFTPCLLKMYPVEFFLLLMVLTIFLTIHCRNPCKCGVPSDPISFPMQQYLHSALTIFRNSLYSSSV